MADSFFIFLVIAGLGAAVGWMSGEKPGWLAVAGVLLAMAALTRSVGIVCLPILLLVTAATVKGSLRHRGMTLVVGLLPGAAVFVLYFAAFKLARGEYAGLTDMSGWNLYSRVAPFADCREFTPPQGTAILCETSPSSQRPGPFGYVWDANSIARRHFALRPNDKLKAFSWQVVLHQPADYLEAVGKDAISNPRSWLRAVIQATMKFFLLPGVTCRSSGWRIALAEISRHHSPSAQGRILAPHKTCSRGWRLALPMRFTLVGMIRSRGQIRFGLFLFGLSGLCLYIVPVLTVSYDFRYGIPAQTLIVVSGLLGIISFWPLPAFRLTNK
jgi:hypothetical protein